MSAEQGWKEWQDSLHALDPTDSRTAFLAGYAASEREWRARIAAEVLEMSEPVHENAHLGLGLHTAKRIAIRILKGGNTP